jgi:putative flippase GtrA
MIELNDTLTKFIKFSIIGFVNTASSYFLYFVLLEFAQVNYLIASAVSYVVGILISYFGNKYWTFRLIRSGWRLEFIKFMILNIAGLAINTLIMLLLVGNYKLDPLIAQLIALSVVIFYNFFGSKFWVFRDTGKI